ncbi:MAG: 50S ribosomal protein L21 [candidate division Zixibacteria bacterium]|nr:50S ribosomal protein L21 [candidate division Zixibacteria bacterium]
MGQTAVVETGGRQYAVAAGDLIYIPRMAGAVGDQITLDRVLLVRDDANTRTGRPHVEGAKVQGEIIAQDRDDKLIVFRFKRRVSYRRKNGHRQPRTRVRITAVHA